MHALVPVGQFSILQISSVLKWQILLVASVQEGLDSLDRAVSSLAPNHLEHHLGTQLCPLPWVVQDWHQANVDAQRPVQLAQFELVLVHALGLVHPQVHRKVDHQCIGSMPKE